MPDEEAHPLEPVYRRLRDQLGLPRKFVRETILPEWWDDEAAETSDGYAEALILLSRHIGLAPESLRAEGQLRPNKPLTVKLKSPQSNDGDATRVAQALAVQVGRLVGLAAVQPVVPLPKSGAELREQILVEGAPWVGFESLLDYCWGHGVAVVHVSNFPSGTKRMHGLAARLGGRPVIVLSWAKRHPAWLLFVLAHELGHLALGHVPEEASIVDEKVEQASEDEEEKQANAYALEVLNGSSQARFAMERWPNARALAREAWRLGKERRVDPGHVVLNYANTMGRSFFAVASAALGELEGSRDGPELVRRRLAKQLDWQRLPADSSEFVMRMTKAARAEANVPAVGSGAD